MWGPLCSMPRMSRGLFHLERSLQLALEEGWEEHVARIYTNLACCAVMSRAYPVAERFLQQGLAYCAEHDLDSLATYMGAWQGRLAPAVSRGTGMMQPRRQHACS